MRVPWLLAFLLLAVLPGAVFGEEPAGVDLSDLDVVPVVRPRDPRAATPPGAAVPGGVPEAPTVPAVPLWRAEASFAAGDVPVALSRFIALTEGYRDDERKGFVWLRAGDLLLSRGDLPRALEAAERAAKLSRSRYLSLCAAYLELRVGQRLKRPARSRELAAFLLSRKFVDADPSLLRAEMARADGAEGFLARALAEFRQAAAAAAPEDAARLRFERDLLVDGSTGILALREAADLEEEPEVRAHLLLTLGTVASRRGFTGMAMFALERAAATGGARGREAAKPLGDLEETASRRPRIVGLLPLSGKYADIGFAVLSGAEVALASLRQAYPDRPAPVLRWVDTAGLPDRARARFLEAAGDPQVLGILGPLTGEEGYSVSIAAGPGSPPVFYLGQKTIPEKPFVYSFGLSPVQEARALMSHLSENGPGDLLLLYPENGYGRGFSEAVAASAAAFGLRVARTVSYSPDITDFTPVIRKAVGEKKFARHAKTKEKGTVIELPAKAVLIADRWDRVFLIASQLRFYNVYTPLAGFSGWYNPELLRKAGDAVAGAVFTTDYPETLPRPESEAFRREYREAFRAVPSRFEAVGYDGAQLMAEALLRAPADREVAGTAGAVVKELLPKLGTFAGSTGTFRFGAAGEMNRSVLLLRVDLGAFVPVRDL